MIEDDLQQDIRHATVRSFVDGVAGGHPVSEVLGLHGSSDAWLLSRLQQENRKPLVILTAEQSQSRQLTTDLQFFHHRPQQVRLLPHWELNPYDPLTPHPELEATRLTTLAALQQGKVECLVLSIRALMQKMIPRQVLSDLSLCLIAEDEYLRPQLLQTLQQLGYQTTPMVEERGSFAVRGDILDIFPPDREEPVRLEFYGDYIERMRCFDPATQRSGAQELKKLLLIPSREMILSGAHLETFGRRLKERCDQLELPRTEREAIMEEVREGILAPGRAFLLPLNYAALDSLFDYLENVDWVIVDPPAVEQEIDLFTSEIRN
ncbi:MAG TPA: transcription-repair coupling factor, partial [Geopsychrobacteraceae bacterium]|nr:transcription-repair coupling factor [Geopsychrobacteraceae bacterium]